MIMDAETVGVRARSEKWLPLFLLLVAGCAAHQRTHSAGLMAALDKEIASGIEKREVADIWQTYQNWSDGRLDASEGDKTWSDKTGNCRLDWYDRLMRDQLHTPSESERLSNALHQALLKDHRGLRDALAIMATHIDVRPPGGKRFREVSSEKKALQIVRNALRQASKAHRRAFSKLESEEVITFHDTAYPNTIIKVEGHTLPDKETGRTTCDLMEKIDRRHLHAALAQSLQRGFGLGRVTRAKKLSRKADTKGTNGSTKQKPPLPLRPMVR